MYFDVMYVYKYVNRSTTKATDTTHLATWTANVYTAKVAIVSFPPAAFISLARDPAIAKDAWKVL